MSTEQTFNLTLEKISLIRSALMSLDTYEKVISENGNERVARVPFALGALRLTIAQNLNRLQPIVDDYTKAHNALVYEYSDGEAVPPRVTPDNWQKYDKVCQEMNQIEHEVKLRLIPEVALNIEINPIPVVSLMALQDIIQ